jgi:uncharacterized protein (TIGR00369 family)
MDKTGVPEGFVRHDRSSPMTEPWEPIYVRRADGLTSLGLRLAKPHTNSRGLIHGGLIASLADNAMGLSCAAHVAGDKSAVTISLTVDFIGPAKTGQWLQIDTPFVRAGGTICFAQSFITADGELCARANATFRVIPRPPATS